MSPKPWEILSLIVFLSTGLPTVGTAQEDQTTFEERSPRSAFLRSLVLPGWGQWYVGGTAQKIRGAVYLAGETALVGLFIDKSLDVDRLTGERALLPDPRQPERLVLEREITLARERREDFLFYGVALLLFNAADALISAHLHNFRGNVTFEGEELALRVGVRILW